MESFDTDLFNKAIDLTVEKLKRKYIQKILELFSKLKPHNDFDNVVYTIKFNDGSKERIKTSSITEWDFIDGPCCHTCKVCQGLKDSSSDSDESSSSSETTIENFN
jgi:hypothetical protein